MPVQISQNEDYHFFSYIVRNKNYESLETVDCISFGGLHTFTFEFRPGDWFHQDTDYWGFTNELRL